MSMGKASVLKDIPVKAIRESKEMLRGCNKQSEDYQELTQAIKSKGLLTPISVRDLGDGTFGLVDGLQRWNVAQDLAWEFIPAQVLSIEEGEILEAQIVANVQRIETKPVEYTKALLRLLEMSPTLTMTELARRLGKSPTWLTERFHLLKLDESLQNLVNEGKIVLANAFALSKVPTDFQSQFLENAMTKPTTEFVPQVQKFVKEHKEATRQGRSVNAEAFTAVPHMQKMADIKSEVDDQKVARALIQQAGTTDPLAIFKLALQWVLHLDPSSIDESKRKYEARKKEAEENKKKRAAEREAKKIEEAKKTLQAAGVTQ